MTTAVSTLPQNTQLPAHLAAAGRHLALNDSALGGIKAGGVPSIGIKGAKFFIKDPSAENPNQLITDSTPGRENLPLMALDVVIIAANPNISKRYYDGPYDKDADDKAPDCSSDNGIMPDAHITVPQNPNCATCPQNQWGSKVNETNGKETKACSDNKRLVIVPLQDLKFKALALDVTPAALKEYGAYIRTLSSRNLPVVGVATRITFDPQASFPKLMFNFLRYLSAEEFAAIEERIDTDEVRNIASPKRVVPIAVATPAAAAPIRMPDATTHSIADATAAAAAALVTGSGPKTGVDAATAAAAQIVTQPAPAGGFAFGGAPATPAADTKKPNKKKAEPAATSQVDLAAAAAAQVVAQQGTVDISTIPEPFKSTIIACGGIDTPGGKAVYDAMPKAAPAATPAPAAPATTFAAAAPSVTVAPAGADLNAQLAALLGKK